MLQISLSSSEGRHCIVFSLVLRPQHQAQELVLSLGLKFSGNLENMQGLDICE